VAAVVLLPVTGCVDHVDRGPLRQVKEPLKLQARKTDTALLAVEQDQVEPYEGAGGLGDSNLLLGRNLSYAHCSDYRPGGFAQYILDGTVKRGWKMPRV